jgi:nitroreductase/NAD-dependent dihydropyrimidine dehydrogenase PreA subunit
MSIFSIDPQKCHMDGLCVAECPVAIITMPDPKAPPQVVPGGEQLCILCGHCAAVCPHGALSLKAMPLDKMPEIKKELQIDAQQAEQFLRSRRSIRQYKDQAVDQATLDKLIDVARYAPSGHNFQPVCWTVFSGAQQRKALGDLVVSWMQWIIKEQPQVAAMLHLDLVVKRWEMGTDGILRSAPHLVVAHAPKNDRTAPAACTIALTYLELMAPALGLGGCWAGFFQAAAATFPPLQEFMALPQGHVTYGAMMVGYPKVGYHRLPLRKEPNISWR